MDPAFNCFLSVRIPLHQQFAPNVLYLSSLENGIWPSLSKKNSFSFVKGFQLLPVRAEKRGSQLGTELADGSLLFSFDEDDADLDSIKSENHLHTNESFQPQRIKSNFVKRSPIPKKTPPRSIAAVPSSPVATPQRPKSKLRKKSPISSPSKPRLSSDNGDSSSISRPSRPASTFVKKSPIPSSEASNRRSLHSADSLPAVPKPPGRFRSNFVKRSPLNQRTALRTVSESTSPSARVAATFRKRALVSPRPPRKAPGAVLDVADAESVTEPKISKAKKGRKPKTAETGTESEENPKPAARKVRRKKEVETALPEAAVDPQPAIAAEHTEAPAEVAENPVPAVEVVSRETLASMKLTDLKHLAKSKGLKGYSTLKKSELVDLIAES